MHLHVLILAVSAAVTLAARTGIDQDDFGVYYPRGHNNLGKICYCRQVHEVNSIVTLPAA